MLVRIPPSALLTIQSIPKAFRRLHEGISVQGLLASSLAFDDLIVAQYALWMATWPSREEIEESMPMLFSQVFRDTHGFAALPPAAGGRWSHSQMSNCPRMDSGCLLARQENKLQTDWLIVSRVFARASFADYRYYWLLVNSRSFYYEIPGTRNPPSADDRMVLCPFVDYFNHQDHGVSESFLAYPPS